MPLAFQSLSHQTVAFGFFNIESDMLLLDKLFFFADRFCQGVTNLYNYSKEKEKENAEVTIHGFCIEDPESIGDLHGAIAGVCLEGFLGATYRQYPFPKKQQDFQQNPLGQQTQAWMKDRICEYGQQTEISLRLLKCLRQVWIGEYIFSQQEFKRLIEYVHRGGYPRWKNHQGPDYVTNMVTELSTLGILS